MRSRRHSLHDCARPSAEDGMARRIINRLARETVAREAVARRVGAQSGRIARFARMPPPLFRRRAPPTPPCRRANPEPRTTTHTISNFHNMKLNLRHNTPLAHLRKPEHHAMTNTPAYTVFELYPASADCASARNIHSTAPIDIRMDYDPSCPGALLTARSILEAHGMPSAQAARLAQSIREASDEWRAANSR